MDEDIRRAARLPPVGVRSLDAIQLSTALLLRDVIEAFLVYDQKLAAECVRAGLTVEAPAPP